MGPFRVTFKLRRKPVPPVTEQIEEDLDDLDLGDSEEQDQDQAAETTTVDQNKAK